MKTTVALILGRVLSLMFVGLAYVMLHRAVRNWCR
jgi:hypothetical protein